MVAAATLGPLATKSFPVSHILPQHTSFRNGVPRLPPLPLRRSMLVQAASVDGEKENKPSSSEGRNLVTAVLEVPLTIWRRMSNPLSNFGFGQRSIWEGGVGLFIASGAVLLALTLVWLRGFQLRSRFRKYQVIFEFSQACGISLGTPARIRGVTVGTVIRVNSSLEGVNALVEVEDDKIVIPRNSLVEVNQSGLLMETMIDITPRDPLPTPSVSPLSEGCLKEGLIVCDREKIRGEQGVSLDALVGIFTRLGREMEEIGVAKSYSLAEKVASVVQEAQPLLVKIEAMAEDVQPLLSEIRGSALLKDIQRLTKTLAQATEDLSERRAGAPDGHQFQRQAAAVRHHRSRQRPDGSVGQDGVVADGSAEELPRLSFVHQINVDGLSLHVNADLLRRHCDHDLAAVAVAGEGDFDLLQVQRLPDVVEEEQKPLARERFKEGFRLVLQQSNRIAGAVVVFLQGKPIPIRSPISLWITRTPLASAAAR